MKSAQLLPAIALIWLAGCWLTGKPAVNPSADPWRSEGRVIVLRPGEDVCTACVGQIVQFTFDYKPIPAEMIETLCVKIDGKRIKKPTFRQSMAPSDPAIVGHADILYEFRAEKPGVYRIEVTPRYLEKGWGKAWECMVIVKGDP